MKKPSKSPTLHGFRGGVSGPFLPMKFSDMDQVELYRISQAISGAVVVGTGGGAKP